MLDKVYSLLGLVICKKSTLRKEVKNVFNYSKKMAENDLGDRESELEEKVNNFLEHLQSAASMISRGSSTDWKVVADSKGRIGWSNEIFPTDQYKTTEFLVGGDE
jgi:hypothetical protein